MPHCIIEHSAALDAELIVPRVFEGALNTGLFEPDGSDIKVRAMAYQHYLTGPQKTDFVHVQLKILAGRSEAQKKQLSEAVLAQLQSLPVAQASFTVEVTDMDRASYAKSVR